MAKEETFAWKNIRDFHGYYFMANISSQLNFDISLGTPSLLLEPWKFLTTLRNSLEGQNRESFLSLMPLLVQYEHSCRKR